MNLRKWMKLFGLTILIGALASVAIGVAMQVNDPEYRNLAADEWLYNVVMMALSGLTFGAFAHMGFFAYLMLNYITRSIFKRPYLWLSVQGFIALFVLVEIVYWTYGSDTLPTHTYWVLPLALLIGATAIAWWKARETSSGAWIPTLFFMIAITVLETLPAFRSDEDDFSRINTILFQLVPLFVCNAYQILRLHRLLGGAAAPQEPASAPTGKSA